MLVKSHGDADQSTPLVSFGGVGVFVAAVREAVLRGDADIAVHSLKDLPTEPAPGLVIAAMPLRQDPRDVLVSRDGFTVLTLPVGARVGTGSPRRAAQLLAARPDLDVVPVRGNVDTRLRTVTDGTLDAVVLARAGLARLDRLDAVSEAIEPDLDAARPRPGGAGGRVPRRRRRPTPRCSTRSVPSTTRPPAPPSPRSAPCSPPSRPVARRPSAPTPPSAGTARTCSCT